MRFLRVLFAVIFCIRRAEGSQIRGSLRQSPIAPLPWCEALRSLSAHERGEASGKAAGLLRNIYSAGRAPGRERTKPAPFVITVSRPLQRLAVRELLGCDEHFLGNVEELEDRAADVAGNKGTEKVPKGVTEPSWRQLCAATNIGLERLRSGAVLLTLELPSAIHDEGNNGASMTGHGIVSALHTQESRASGRPAPNAPVQSPTVATKGETLERTEPLGDLSDGLCTLTEAAMLQAVALTLVETADILVLPLLYDGIVSTSRSQGSREAHEFGELLCIQRTARETEESQGTNSDPSHAGNKYRPEPKFVNDHFCLPKDVSQLLQAMRQLIHDAALQDEASSSTRQSRVHPNASMGQVSSVSSRPRRLPVVVIAVEGPVSQARQEAICTEIRAQLGSPEGKRNHIENGYREGQARDKCTGPYVDGAILDECDVFAAARVRVVGVQRSEGRNDARIEMDLLIQGIEPRNASATRIADALAALLTRHHISAPPNAFEFAAHALSSIACATACRVSLADAKEGLRRLQRQNPQSSARQPFGSLAQGILSKALTRYDYQTRRYQLSVQRRALREELTQSIEREIRTIFLREALQVESDIRLSLRADLVTALQRDARRFESLATGIIRKALMTLDERLTRLLPNKADFTGQRCNESMPFNQAMAQTSLPSLARISDAFAKAGRNSQLCSNLYHSLLEIQFLLLQKSARDFSAMAAELSRSPLAAVLRQQHGRPWLGISVRPLLSITSLLRLRGDGNLQGYSRYNAGPFQFLFGYDSDFPGFSLAHQFTNDGEGLESGQNAAFRLQPKLHFDVEVD